MDQNTKDGQKKANKELILATFFENNSFAIRYINKAANDPATELIKNKDSGLYPVSE